MKKVLHSSSLVNFHLSINNMKHNFIKLGKSLSFAVMLLLLVSNITKAQTITENFDNTTTWVSSGGTTISTVQIGTSTQSTWIYSGGNAQSGSFNSGTRGFTLTNSGSAYLITPVITGGVATVSVTYKNSSNNATMGIGIATNLAFPAAARVSTVTTGASPWLVTSQFTNGSTSTAVWSTWVFSVTGVNSTKPAYIKFFRVSGTVFIDDITITGPALASPTLSASSGQSVDNDFGITFTDDATWRGAVTGITVDGTAYTSSSYTLSAGSLSLSHTAITELHTAGSHTIVVLATGYTNASVTQSNVAGADNNLQITTQPAAPASNGGLLATQPVVKFRDQYNNITASTSNVVATVGSGTWTIGGTTTKAGVAGVATFTDLTATSAASVTGATITFTSGSLTITSNGFNIPAPVGATPPTLVAASPATVDNNFSITFSPDDATWRSSITSVSVGGNALPGTAYDATVAGQLTLKPSQSAFLQTAGTYSITVSSTGYSDDVVSQTISPGADNKLAVTTQPTAPATNGGTLAIQPVVKVEDQYGNVTSSSANVVAAVTSPQTWTIGGTTTKAASSGTATFTNLTAGTSDGSSFTGATITFTSGGLTAAISGQSPASPFNIPAYLSAATDRFRSVASTDWNTASTWQSSPDGTNWYAANGANAIPGNSATSIELQSPFSVTMNSSNTISNTTIDAGATLTMGSSAVLTIGGSKVLTVLGILSNPNTSSTAIGGASTTALLFATASGAGTYKLTGNGGQVPAATWVNGSNNGSLNITGITDGANLTSNGLPAVGVPGAGGFGNITIDLPSYTGSTNAFKPWKNFPNTLTIAGNLTLGRSGSGSGVKIQLASGSNGNTVNVTGNVNVYGGDWEMNNFTTIVWSVTGNVNIDATNTSLGAAAPAKLEISTTANTTTFNIAGNLTMTSGVTNKASLTQSSGTANVVFNGSSAQTITFDPTNTTGTINYNVSNSAGVILGSALTVNGALALTSGKLSIGANTLTLAGTVSGMSATNSLTGGASSVLSVSGTGSLGSLFFDQTTPGTTNELSSFTINRTSSGALTLSNTVAIANTLTITAGTVTLTSTSNTAGNLTIGGAGTDNGTWGSASSSATFKNSAFASTGIVTVSNNTAATPTVTVTGNATPYTYNGSPQGPNTASNTGTGSSYTFSYVGTGGTTYGPSVTQPTNPGTYTVTATVAVSTDGFYKQNSSSASAFTINGVAQSVADFRSNGSGNFSSASNWQYDAGGGTWTTATQAPSNTNNVTVRNGNDIVLDADYTVGSGKTLTLNATSSLTINPTVTLTIAGTTDFNGQHVIVKSDATGTGSIGQITGTLSNASNATVERYIQSNGGTRAWRLLSVPTQGNQTINNAWQENQTAGANNGSGFGTIITAANNLSTWAAEGFDYQQQDASMLTYNMGANTWDNVTTTNGNTAGNNPANGKLATTSGYFLYVRGNRSEAPAPIATGTTIATLRSTGALYQGNVTTSGIGSGQFALIGNVYASPIDFTAVTKPNIDGVFYVWDPKLLLGGSLGHYQTFSATTTTAWAPLIPGGSYTTGVPNTLIQTGQAFFIHSTAGSGSITLTEASKLNNYNDVFRPQTPTGAGSQLTTNLYEGSTDELSDVAVSVFSSSYSDAVDKDDAIKLASNGTNMGISRAGKILSIEGRQEISSTDTIFYNMWNLKAQSYKFSFVPSGLNTGLTAYLQDSYLGTSIAVDLNSGSSVAFTVDNNAASSKSDRFRLVFSGSSPVPVTFSSVQAYQQSTAIDVKWSVSAETGVSSYVIERSNDGINFSKVGVVSATNAGGSASYIYADNAPVAGANYYRIRSVGISGDSRYTSIVKVDIGSMKAGIAIYPNPVTNGRLGLQLQNLGAGKYGLRVFTGAGQEVYKSQVNHAGGNATQVLTLPAGLAGGMYRLEMVSPQGSRYVEKLIIK